MRFCYLPLILVFLNSPVLAATTYTMDSHAVPTVQYVTPTTGATVNVNATGYIRLIINPAGSLLALTIAFPGSPTDADVVQICSSQAITTLTMSGGTVIGPLTTMAIGTFASYIYNATSSSWFRNG